MYTHASSVILCLCIDTYVHIIATYQYNTIAMYITKLDNIIIIWVDMK